MSLLSTLAFALIPIARKWPNKEEEINRLKEENAQLKADLSYWRTACNLEMQWRRHYQREEQLHNKRVITVHNENYAEYIRNCTPSRSELLLDQQAAARHTYLRQDGTLFND